MFVLGRKMLLYYDLLSRLHTWLSCTACILASRGCSCLASHLTLNRNTSLGAQRYMLCRCHKHRLTYTIIRTLVKTQSREDKKTKKQVVFI